MSYPETEKLLRDQITDYLQEVYEDKHADSPAYEITEIIKRWLEQSRKAQDSKILVHSNKINRQLMIDDLIRDLEI
jgi:hypothetical protein